MAPNLSFLVLGACGNVGQWVVHELAARFPERKVRGSYRPHGVTPPPDHWKSFSNITPVEVELEDQSSIAKAMDGVDRVLFINQNTPRQLDHDLNVLHVARETKTIEFCVKQSLYKTQYRDGMSCSFIRMHAEAEADLEKSGLKYAVLRPNFQMANVFFMILPTLPYGAIQWPFPEDLRLPHVDPRDVGAIGALLLGTSAIEEMHGRDVHVMGPELWKVNDMVAEVASACGQPDTTYRRVSHEDFKSSLVRDANMTEWMADSANEMFRAVQRACEADGMYSDDTGPDGIIPFEEKVGRPKHTFKEFLDFFSIEDAYHRLRQFGATNPSSSRGTT